MSEIDDVLLELRDVGIRQLPEAGDAGDRRVRQALEEEMARGDRRFAWAANKGRTGMVDPRSGNPSRLRRAHRRRRFALAGGIAIAGLAVAGVLGSQDSGFTPSPAVAATMNRLGTLAAGNLAGIPGPGQYLYTDSTEMNTLYKSTADASVYPLGGGNQCKVITVGDQQEWLAADGSGVIKSTNESSRFTSPADQAACADMNVTDPTVGRPLGTTVTDNAGPGELPITKWNTLSTDPATLLQQIHQLDGGANTPNTAVEEFVNVGDVMRAGGAPPAIYRALYKAAALIPGVKLTGSQTDPTGQTGLGVAMDDGQGRTEQLIFDRQTGRLLADETFDNSTGKLIDWVANTQQKIVDNAPTTPPSTTAPQATTTTP